MLDEKNNSNFIIILNKTNCNKKIRTKVKEKKGVLWKIKGDGMRIKGEEKRRENKRKVNGR